MRPGSHNQPGGSRHIAHQSQPSSIVGLNITSDTFQIYGQDIHGSVLIKKQLQELSALSYFSEISASLVGVERSERAISWAQKLSAHRHHVKLMPRSYLSSFSEYGKNEVENARICCKAVQRLVSPTRMNEFERRYRQKCLTPREIEVLFWAGNGKTSWEISRIVSRSEATVNFHMKNILVKLDSVNKSQAVARAVQLRLIEPLF